MSKKIILINETDDESRIAIVIDNVLQEMLIEHIVSEQTKNNIYKAVVVQIQPSLQAAFVDYGEKKHGFLPNNEINLNLSSNKKFHRSDSINQKLKIGQELMVQVTREPADHKGAALTSNITLPGRFMVLMPNTKKGGISKKIDDVKERERLKNFLTGIESEEHSVIIRTAGIGRSLAELKKDYTALKKIWEDLQKSFKNQKKAELILEEADMVTRTLRDYYTEDVEEIWVDNPETFQKALHFLKEVAPRRQKDLKLFVGDRSLFATYNIERQVEQLTSNQVKLKSGGSIVIDQTEALVAIDVNSGKSNQDGNVDSMALRTNLEAADEVARQLRLRNLGGLIVVDFIDMENESYRKQVEEKLENAMRMDKAQTRFNPISQFGLLEMSRERLTVGISSTVESTCPICNGKGKIPSLLASTNLIIRSIREIAAKGNITGIDGELPLALVNNLLNERRQSISDLELEFGISIILRGNPDLLVFNEQLLKPIYDKKQSYKPPGKKDVSKPEQSRKKGRKQGKDATTQKVDKKTDRKEIKNDSIKKHKKHQDIESVESQELSVKKDKPVSANKSKDTDDKLDGITNNSTIHPSALFTDIRELDQNEMDEITVSFENRLKGKIDNQIPQRIDEKYLWKSHQNGQQTENNKNVEFAREELSEEQMKESTEPSETISEKKLEKKGATKTKSKKTKTRKTSVKQAEKTDDPVLNESESIELAEDKNKPATKSKTSEKTPDQSKVKKTTRTKTKKKETSKAKNKKITEKDESDSLKKEKPLTKKSKTAEKTTVEESETPKTTTKKKTTTRVTKPKTTAKKRSTSKTTKKSSAKASD